MSAGRYKAMDHNYLIVCIVSTIVTADQDCQNIHIRIGYGADDQIPRRFRQIRTPQPRFRSCHVTSRDPAVSKNIP